MSKTTKILGYDVIREGGGVYPLTIEINGIFVNVAKTMDEALTIIRRDITISDIGFVPEATLALCDNYSGNITGYNTTIIKQLQKKNNNIILTELAYKKLCYYADAQPIEEISGLGEVIMNNNQFLITDIYCLHQESNNGSTILDKQDICQLQAKLISQGKTTSNLRLWWHTHGNGGTFWSPTDENNIDDFACDKFMVSIVMNSIKHEMLGRIDFYKPHRGVINNIQPTLLLNKEDEKLKKECTEEAKKKNRRKVYVQKNLITYNNKLLQTRGFLKS